MTPIEADMTVRGLLTAYPQTFEVLLSHGMCADCKHNPPPVSLSHFAGKHCGGDVDALLAELRAAVASAEV